jgi:hypothetical protein
MLFKDLISTYGSSFAREPTPLDDPVWHLAQSEELMIFRRYALDALSLAKVYLLDHAAAAYADTLYDTMQGEAEAKGVAAMSFLGEVDLPAEVAWVEFDYRALVVSRVERASPSSSNYQNPTRSEERGFLIDNRVNDFLRVTMFSRPANGKIMDPLCNLTIDRTPQGNLDLNSLNRDLNFPMVDFLVRRGYTKEEIEGFRDVHFGDTATDLFIPYAFFAMLASPDLGGIIPSPDETFSPKDIKTARKFGKSWVLGAPKSHMTIRIGPQAAAHMQERLARLEFERQSQGERNGPVRHWVREHERHYKSGKVVLVPRHARGDESLPSRPTRVMGPAASATEFVFPLKGPCEDG